MRGDANLDEQVDVSDAVLLAKFVSGDTAAKITDQGKLNADVNQNGAPDDDDITLILKIIVKLI
jgi:hypothetical protein